MKNGTLRYVVVGFLLCLCFMLLIGGIERREDTGRYKLHMAEGAANAFFNIIDTQTGIVKTYVRGEHAGRKSFIPGKKYESYQYYFIGSVDFNAEEEDR